MLQSMKHETSYTCTSCIDYRNGWYCGCVSADGGANDEAPEANGRRSRLLFTGECYADNAGARRGIRSVRELLESFEKHGADFAATLNGWFAGVLLDAESGKAVLFNDRYGMRKLYWYEEPGAFYFASEAKALLRVVPALRDFDPRSVAEYLCFDSVLDDRTYFPNVRAIPNGSVWIFDRDRVQKKSYFDTGYRERRPPLAPREFTSRFAETFARVLPRYLSGDRVSIGLTGGLDTRLMLAYLPRDTANLSAFTFAGMYGDSCDLRIARQLCLEEGLSHTCFRLGPDFLSNFAAHAEHCLYVTDGQADVTNVDSFYFAHRMRNSAPVELLGMFGSQVLGRVRRALRRRVSARELLAPDFMAQVEAASKALQPFRDEHALTYLLKREIPWYWSRFAVPQMSQQILRSPYLDNDLIDLLYQAPPGVDGSALEVEAIMRVRRELLDIPTNKGVGGRLPWPLSVLVHAAIRSRLLADKALNWDALPWSLHHAVSRIDSVVLAPLRLDRLVFGCEFYRHYNRWFRRELAPYLQSVLLDPRTLSRPYWNGRVLARMLDEHIRGRRRWLSELRKVLTLELVHRLLVEQKA